MHTHMAGGKKVRSVNYIMIEDDVAMNCVQCTYIHHFPIIICAAKNGPKSISMAAGWSIFIK